MGGATLLQNTRPPPAVAVTRLLERSGFVLGCTAVVCLCYRRSGVHALRRCRVLREVDAAPLQAHVIRAARGGVGRG